MVDMNLKKRPSWIVLWGPHDIIPGTVNGPPPTADILTVTETEASFLQSLGQMISLHTRALIFTENTWMPHLCLNVWIWKTEGLSAENVDL